MIFCLQNPEDMENYCVIGIMSGSSMDGVDLACCDFTFSGTVPAFRIRCAETIPYPEIWKARLANLHQQPAFIYPKTDTFYGRYLGQLVKEFILRHDVAPDLVSSHGHTIFHQPLHGFTAQIGDGAAIHAETGLPVVCNFRTVDVALGGQGAPLVPVGDRDLFTDYDACLNLGGFANITLIREPARAFDICPCNIVMNHVTEWMQMPYDKGGAIAASGSVHAALLAELDALAFYSDKGAKSLGREWCNDHFWPAVKPYDPIREKDLLATFSMHIATQITKVLNENNCRKVLVTGGGAWNDHLVKLIRSKSSAEIIVPHAETVNYKEALIFAYLGVLRLRSETNSLASVTGAARDSIGGALYGNIPHP